MILLALQIVRNIIIIVVILTCIGCVHTKPIPMRAMEFEPGIKVLAGNLADQLEKSSVGNLLNKVVINQITKQPQLKKIVIDPFINVETGYPVKVNDRIAQIFKREIAQRFQVTGELEPKNLEVSEYVMNGVVRQQGEKFRVTSTVFEKDSGKVLASATVILSSFDNTPMDIYKDSPVYLKGKNYEQHIASVSKQPDQAINDSYHRRLALKALLVKGDSLYEQKEFKKSLEYYNQAAERQGGNDQLEVLNGQFTNLVKDGDLSKAEEVFTKLLKVSIAECSEISNKITFKPNSRTPVENKLNIYTIYLKEIARLVASQPECRVKIVGHCSRTGSETYNDKLSLERAEWIQKQLAIYDSGVRGKATAAGRGYKDNIVGNGKDDLSDEIDRRVEFAFEQCGE